MPAQHRQKRLPISCEPCRIRKIRCSRPRGPPPCETCVRRALAPDCAYARRDAASFPATTPTPPDGPSLLPSSSLNESLVARVARLEAMLQPQDRNEQEAQPAQLVSPQGNRKGTLSFSSSGHVRYMPASNSRDGGQSLSYPQQAAAGSIDMGCGPYPFGRKQVDPNDLLHDLPARSHCARLKKVYFESFASLFHILHDPTFDEQYAEFERAPDSMPYSWLALLFAILGTAVTALEPSSELLRDLSMKENAADQIAELSERYRRAAFRCLEADNYLWQQTVNTLQTLIVLIYGINHSHGQAWTLLGMTYHIALNIGCHVDPIEFGLNAIRCEERRRCWAGIMMLYMLQNTSLGHLGPDPRQASEGVQLPADLNDADLVTAEQVSTPSRDIPTQMSYLLLKFRLYDVSSNICALVLSAQQPPPSLIDAMDKAIEEEKQSWDEKYLAHSASAPLSTCHEAHLNILYGYAHQLTLLLHHHSMRTSLSHTSQYRRSSSRCMSSATELLRIHAIFSTRVDFSPFRWYLRGVCSFHAFHATVSLITILANHSWEESARNILPSIRGCADRFESLIEVSPICAKAAPVLRCLLESIETWSIEIGSQRSSDSSILQTPTVSNQLQIIPESALRPDRFNDRYDLNETYQLVPDWVDDMFEHLDPQSWLSPSGMTWNHWDSVLSKAPTIDLAG